MIKSDYLKYYRVIKKYIKVKYKLREDELDVLLFLYSEPMFFRERAVWFESILTWKKTRFQEMIEGGYIASYRFSPKTNKKAFKLTPFAIKIVDNMYNLLEGKEIPTGTIANPMFKKNVGYSDKVYRNMILKLNAAIYADKRQRLGKEGYVDPNTLSLY